MPRQIVVTVKPGSSKGPLVETNPTGSMTVYVREPATDGRANKAVAQILAEHLGVPKSKIALVGGATSRTKRFRVY
ncbi:DUF167 domain-containing protein [Gordonia sp. PKS22-38]|uniref:DUF167 domain-containing protein n=1 Tax=Gordonia prachuapensis TaxID=3115651 RepID=A0ABU7MQ31_9ACTN|nr:DUF167 domain-containing protein [Gordonia sp. PKS22-38]